MPLTERQRRAIDLLLSGRGPVAVARALGVTTSTLWRWRHEHAAFAAEVERRRRELAEGAASGRGGGTSVTRPATVPALGSKPAVHADARKCTQMHAPRDARLCKTNPLRVPQRSPALTAAVAAASPLRVAEVAALYAHRPPSPYLDSDPFVSPATGDAEFEAVMAELMAPAAGARGP
jgi:hypothetical protein